MNKIALRVTDAAYALSCSSGVIYKLIRTGKVEYYKRGRDYFIMYTSLVAYAERMASHKKL